ncbi:MAG: putative lumazine-binding [Solirubrobacteraceae bacterium]|jgi:copper chaperone CopZ|nr:putative lumazine-binding [Solirubrobacteraceae bacterium]MEA2334942.1 putative lumazine-binding [Solirubrobacteraceae bacterium]
MRSFFKRASLQLCAVLLVVGLSACATTVSTSGYKGEAKDVAQTIKDFQSDVTAGDEKKVCDNDLAGPVVKSLGSTPGGCQKVIKDQLKEIASFQVDVQSIQITSAAHAATARVKSKYSGKNKISSIQLVKEAGKWKIAKFS